MISVYTTCKNKKEAGKIADHLLKKRLIVCANFFPVDSKYWWKGKIESGKEYAIIMKTKEGKFNKIVKEIEKIHSYELPGISKEKIEVNKKAASWIKKEVR